MNSLSKSIDAAVILSITTGGLYLVGWAHWWAYFKYFGINPNQIALSLHEVIATTVWILFPLVIFYLLIGYLTDVKEMSESNYFVSAIIKLMNCFSGKFLTVIYSTSLLFISAGIVYLKGSQSWIFFSSTFLFALSIFIISFYFVGEVLNKNYSMKNLTILLVLALFYNVYTGFVKADRISNGSDGQKISIEFKEDESEINDYIYISYMNGFFYLHKQDSIRWNFQTLMVHESNIKQAIISD